MIIYVYKRVLPLTHSLTQHGPNNSMENWLKNFGIQISFEVLSPTKTVFCGILTPSSPQGGRHEKYIFKHNSVPNYFTTANLHKGWLEFNAKKSFSGILDFLIFRDGGKGEKH